MFGLLLTSAKAWLETKLAILRWAVLGLAVLASVWATHRIDILRQNEKTLTVIQHQIEVVHDTKVIHDKVMSLPGPDITDGLLHWTRKD